MKASHLFVIATACLLLAGCKKPNPIEGKWSGTSGETATFTETNFTVQGEAGNMGSLSMSGTYKLDKDQLTLTPTDVKVQAKDPSKQAEYEKQVGTIRQVLFDSVAKANPVTIAFPDADHMKMTSKIGEPRTYTRLKT